MSSAETQRQITPRIYAASLSDYNNGVLHGRWIDVTSDIDDMQQAINEMLAASPTSALGGEPAEEWAIHDFDDFGDIRVDEHRSLANIARWAEGMKRHGEAFAAWVAHFDDQSEDLIQRFEECYQGEWDNIESYAEHLLEELGARRVVHEAPGWLQPYLKLDVEAFARDLELTGDADAVEMENGRVSVFTS